MNFRQLVYHYVDQIPKGKVSTYGNIAALTGNPRLARQVGFALHSLGMNELQRQLLQAEGVEIGDDLIVDLIKYGWEK